jgi:hypothetical protein
MANVDVLRLRGVDICSQTVLSTPVYAGSQTLCLSGIGTQCISPTPVHQTHQFLVAVKMNLVVYASISQMSSWFWDHCIPFTSDF